MPQAELQSSFEVLNRRGASSVVLVCEHASAHIPAAMNGLGLSEASAQSHAAWDPGARGLALAMSTLLDAPLVAGTVSRLVYDCNRPPTSPAAILDRSEAHDVPGNRNLTPAARTERAATYYAPFRAAVAGMLDRAHDPVLVTVHSFTPVFDGHRRMTEIGILHDTDSRLADAMLANATDHTPRTVARNDPYGPAQGVTHTLQVHALPRGRPNVMLEVRNDLLTTLADQTAMAGMLSRWIAAAFATLALPGDVECRG